MGRNATVQEVKRAYRRKALKLHPDVNKAADAREKFMECKNAYQAILEPQQQSGSRPGASGGGPSWGGWDARSGGSRQQQQQQGRRPQQPPEEFYGFGEL